METELSMKFGRLMVLFIGIPFAIYFSKNVSINRKKYSIYLFISVILFFVGSNLWALGYHPAVASLLFLSIWLFYFSTAARFHDVGKSKWYALLCLAGPVLLIVPLYLFFKPTYSLSSETNDQ